MKSVYNKKLGATEVYPETVMEAVEMLQEFFEADMWHAKDAEWTSEEAMINYLRAHFKNCKDEIKKIQNEKA